jgi:hypothetical protein
MIQFPVPLQVEHLTSPVSGLTSPGEGLILLFFPSPVPPQCLHLPLPRHVLQLDIFQSPCINVNYSIWSKCQNEEKEERDDLFFPKLRHREGCLVTQSPCGYDYVTA